MKTVYLANVDATLALGMQLGQFLPANSVVALVGDLGTGKTVLTQGIGRGLEVPSAVQSPTFVLVQEHLGGRLPLWHADLYRLEHPADVEQLGLEEMMESDGVVVVEWADRFPTILPTDHLWVDVRDAPEGARTVSIRATGPRHGRVLERLNV